MPAGASRQLCCQYNTYRAASSRRVARQVAEMGAVGGRLADWSRLLKRSGAGRQGDWRQVVARRVAGRRELET